MLLLRLYGFLGLAYAFTYLKQLLVQVPVLHDSMLRQQHKFLAKLANRICPHHQSFMVLSPVALTAEIIQVLNGVASDVLGSLALFHELANCLVHLPDLTNASSCDHIAVVTAIILLRVEEIIGAPLIICQL